MKKDKTDNLGFTLVELIVAVAIMSILLGVSGYGLSLSSGRPAEECARKLAAAVQHGRTTTMGKYRNVITVSKEAGTGRITVKEHIVHSLNDDGTENEYADRKSVVGSKNVMIEYSTDGGTSFTELAEGDEITLRFDSGSGALKKTALGGTQYYTTFRISKAGTVKYLKLESLTGRVTVEESL